MTTTRADITRGTSSKPRDAEGARRSASMPILPRVPRRYGQWAATVLFLLVTVLAAGWLWQQKSDRVEVWQATSEVPAGAVIQREDLSTVQVAGLPDAVQVSDVDQLVGSTAVVGLVPGQVLTRDMVTPDPVPTAGERVVGIAVDGTRAPAGLSPGDVLTVLAVPPSGEASSPAQLQAPTVLTDRARVLAVGRAEAGSTRLTLVISQSQANRVAGFGAAGRVAVVQAPVGGDR
jgi:hypothetical protein